MKLASCSSTQARPKHSRSADHNSTTHSEPTSSSISSASHPSVSSALATRRSQCECTLQGSRSAGQGCCPERLHFYASACVCQGRKKCRFILGMVILLPWLVSASRLRHKSPVPSCEGLGQQRLRGATSRGATSSGATSSGASLDRKW